MNFKLSLFKCYSLLKVSLFGCHFFGNSYILAVLAGKVRDRREEAEGRTLHREQQGRRSHRRQVCCHDGQAHDGLLRPEATNVVV